MLYQLLRPKTLAEVIGNRSAVQALARALADLTRCPRAFLFYGPSGTGKTTLARILAGAVDGLGDFVEVNAADTRGIDDIRALISSTQVAPLYGRARVILLDECHQLTKPAQNALLKGLEDAPETVWWVLCSTEPDGLIPTVRNRCTQVATALLKPPELAELVRRGFAQYQTSVSDALLGAIVAAAEGSPRRALVLTEQVFHAGGEAEALDLLRRQLSEGQAVETIDLCRAVAKRAPWPQVAALVNGCQEEPERVRIAITHYLRTCLLSAGDAASAAGYAQLIEGLSRPLLSGSARAELPALLYLALSKNGAKG